MPIEFGYTSYPREDATSRVLKEGLLLDRSNEGHTRYISRRLHRVDKIKGSSRIIETKLYIR